MTDHYAEATSAIETAQHLREALNEAHAARPKDIRLVAVLEGDLRHKWTEAKLHTNLALVQQAHAQVQALEDLRGEVAALAQDLRGEPEPVEPPPPLRLADLAREVDQ